MKQIIKTEKAPKAIGPYSQAVLAKGVLYCSGQIAIDPITNELIISDIESETKQVMNNLNAVLQAANMDFKNVVKCSIFLKDMNQYSLVNNIYSSYFKDNPPAREAVQVSVLPKNVNVEISLIAVE
ncbi:MAG: Rid family detoxifying hydrolase [Flavobacteriales bacterium]